MKNFGLDIKPRAPEDFEHQLGASKIHKTVHRPDGQWISDVPIGEMQERLGVETMSCVSFGTLSILEMIEEVKFGRISNYSDRFLAIASNTTTSGNDPKVVAQTLRKVGAIDEDSLPFTDNILTFDEYHSPKPLPQRLLNEGRKWLEKFELSYEWVTPTPENLMEELKYGPVGIAVEAWNKGEKGYYYGGENSNHWTALVGFDKGNFWIVFDSYPETSGSYIKLLDWSYTFKIAMSYSLNKKENIENKWWYWLWPFFGADRYAQGDIVPVL